MKRTFGFFIKIVKTWKLEIFPSIYSWEPCWDQNYSSAASLDKSRQHFATTQAIFLRKYRLRTEEIRVHFVMLYLIIIYVLYIIKMQILYSFEWSYLQRCVLHSTKVIWVFLEEADRFLVGNVRMGFQNPPTVFFVNI